MTDQEVRAAVAAARRFGVSPPKRLLLEYAARRAGAQRPWFGYRDSDRVLRRLSGLTSVPNMHRHVADLADALVFDKRGEHKGARFRLNDEVGIAVVHEWRGAQASRIDQRRGTTPAELAELARSARDLMDDLIAQLVAMRGDEPATQH